MRFDYKQHQRETAAEYAERKRRHFERRSEAREVLQRIE
jgi:hypothetical protein